MFIIIFYLVFDFDDLLILDFVSASLVYICSAVGENIGVAENN